MNTSKNQNTCTTSSLESQSYMYLHRNQNTCTTSSLESQSYIYLQRNISKDNAVKTFNCTAWDREKPSDRL